MTLLQSKRSAIHNLVVTGVDPEPKSRVREGLAIPSRILRAADILPFERIIVTRIDGGIWTNRVETIALAGNDPDGVLALGSLASFLKQGEMTCIISMTLLDESQAAQFRSGGTPIRDVGFDGATNRDNKCEARIVLETGGSAISRTLNKEDESVTNGMGRFLAASVITGLIVNRTHPDCLQGSAELPLDVMAEAGLQHFEFVNVHNLSTGAVATTYAVPMPPGVVMTTGAMSTFAPLGSTVSVASYRFCTDALWPRSVCTDGSSILRSFSGPELMEWWKCD